jgi:hypothetical protein
MSQDDLGLGPEGEAALAALLDELVPARPDGRLAGAGALGLAADVVRAMRERPPLRALVVPGLAALAAIVRARGAARLADLAPADRRAALAALAAEAPALLPTLAFVAFIAYYQDPRVLAALGREPRPPFPKGYELAPFDPALLEPVRRRAPFYREP